MRAQKILVDRFIDWGRVERRLSLYPAVSEHFPVEILRQGAETPPYFCHYLAWRLGT